MGRGFFVTATDTDAGKTLVSCALLLLLSRAGHTVAGYKPVAAGAEGTGAGLRNEDAILLKRFSNAAVRYEDVNPVVLAPAIAPHIAAGEAGVRLDPASLAAGRRRLGEAADLVITEGAGGWLVPLNDGADMADLAMAIGDPVILVVAMRLGCINHALLTAESVLARGANLIAWVANRVDRDMAAFEENVSTLENRLPAPLLGVVPRLDETDPAHRIRRAAAALDPQRVIAALARS